jgi:hypothetical protein
MGNAPIASLKEVPPYATPLEATLVDIVVDAGVSAKWTISWRSFAANQ